MIKNYKDSIITKIARLFFLITCTYGTTDYCLPKEIVNHNNTFYGSKYIYLTNICLYITVTCLFMGNMVRQLRVQGLLEIYRHTLCLMLPLNCLVSILFWTLFYIDPTLIRDKDLYNKNIRISLFSDLCVHLFPFLSLLVEHKGLIIKSHPCHCIFYILFTVTYYFICYYFSKLNNMWVYPLLGKLDLKNRILLFFFSTILVIFIYKMMMYFIKNEHENLNKY
ncbi:integral membrane [Vairimorpha apis BRL 01]|uniref:Integral membrane n=1 Tax=Vairimorpha apis BRL 01 TaxID=1037528 RepID=T0MMY7_9MICR|nr:integral membrane [Vairimorpha apis BRL 01]